MEAGSLVSGPYFHNAASVDHVICMRCKPSRFSSASFAGFLGESAVEWYELASKEGSEKGRYHAARCYHEGVGGACVDRARAADVLGASVWELGERRNRGSAAREREKENRRGSRVPV